MSGQMLGFAPGPVNARGVAGRLRTEGEHA